MTNYLIIELRGGLGNQLFGLAAGWYLASKTNRELVLDARFLKWKGSNSDRSLELDKFEFELPHGKMAFRKTFIGLGNFRLIRKSILKVIDALGKLKKTSNTSDLWEDRDLIAAEINHNPYLSGAFYDFAWAINSRDLNFPEKLELTSKSEAVQMFQGIVTGLCAVHIRLTDFLMYPDVFPELSSEYYESALAIMRQQGFERFAIFTDDVELAREKYPSIFSLPDLCLIPDTFNASETFFLMESCAGIICSSSSFSSWAAFFISSNSHQIIVPNLLLLDGSSDPRPVEWTRLDHKTGDPN